MKKLFRSGKILGAVSLLILVALPSWLGAREVGSYGSQQGKTIVPAWQVTNLIQSICFPADISYSYGDDCYDLMLSCSDRGYGACLRYYCKYERELDQNLQPVGNYFYFCEPSTPQWCQMYADAWSQAIQNYPACQP